MKTFMFPGQGSQSRGMGGALFDEFKELTVQADHILGYSIKELCLEDRDGALSKTQFTQPALYVVNALTYFKKIRESGIPPDFLAGHSLGDFNALLAASISRWAWNWCASAAS
jgi:malonyl CoA-acyl carrier protein transacylase